MEIKAYPFSILNEIRWYIDQLPLKFGPTSEFRYLHSEKSLVTKPATISDDMTSLKNIISFYNDFPYSIGMALWLGFCGTRNIGTLSPFQSFLTPPGEVDLILN